MTATGINAPTKSVAPEGRGQPEAPAVEPAATEEPSTSFHSVTPFLHVRDVGKTLEFLKDAFAYAHKATAKLTSQNLTAMVPSAFGNEKVARVSMATVPVWHSYDHYGQMVVYARMNGVVPPASRR